MFGDSSIVIRQVSKAKGLQNSILPPILQRIVLQAQQFEQIEFFHTLRKLNSTIDSLANKGTMLGPCWNKGPWKWIKS